MELKTSRLTISPMTEAELTNCIMNAPSEELKAAYQEMETGAMADPNNRIWYVPWKICLRKTDICVGDVGFKGPANNKSVEIGYGLNKAYEKNGYMTEAVGAMCEWAFMQPEITFIEAETAPENEASKRVLERLDFKPDGEGKEGPRYVLLAPKSAYLSIYMCLGVGVGCAIGAGFNNMPIGMCLGIGAGMLVGAFLDAKNKKERAEEEKARKAGKDS